MESWLHGSSADPFLNEHCAQWVIWLENIAILFLGDIFTLAIYNTYPVTKRIEHKKQS